MAEPRTFDFFMNRVQLAKLVGGDERLIREMEAFQRAVRESLPQDVAAAQTAADEVTGDTSIANSYVSGLTLTSSNDGADCSVTISPHQRIYGNDVAHPVAVNGGGFSGIPHNTIVRVYYDQASRAGGAVSYQWTSDPDVAAQNGDRHSVGSVVTPRVLEMSPVEGGGVRPPGYAIP